MRVDEYIGHAGERVWKGTFTMARLPADDREDDPVAGDPAKQILGDWQRIDAWPGRVLRIHFGADGRWLEERDGGRLGGTYRFLPDGQMELTGLRDPEELRRVIFTAKRMALITTGSGVNEKGQPWYQEHADIYERIPAGMK
jgi:hypothetical protein